MQASISLTIMGLVASISDIPRTTSEIDLKRVYVEPVVINKVEVRAPTYLIDEPKLRLELKGQFDAWIIRSITRQHLSAEAIPLEGETPGADAYVLRTEFDIPLTHGASMSHRSNQLRRGKFMEYHLSLASPAGRVVANVNGSLTWSDGAWSRFRHRGRPGHRPSHFALPHNEVLKGYVRKAIDRGVSALKKATEIEVGISAITVLDGLETKYKKEFQS